MIPIHDIVFLGGSFNPPTLAHKALLRQAVNAVHAKEGIFVPSSGYYVRRKCSKSISENIALPQEARYRMLRSLCDPDMSVCTDEFGDTTKGRTARTYQYLKEQFPDSRIWFIAGDDKLRTLPAFRMPADAYYIIINRSGKPKDELKNHPFLVDKPDRVIIIDPLSDYPDTSSSNVQKYYREHNDTPHPDVNQTTHNILTAYVQQQELDKTGA